MVLYQPTGRQSDTDTFKVAILFFLFCFYSFVNIYSLVFFSIKIALMTLIVLTCIMELIQVKEQNYFLVQIRIFFLFFFYCQL